MLPVASKVILEHVFDSLIDVGITDIIVVVGYKRNRIQSYFGSSYRNGSLTYVTQESQLGTGHALLMAKSRVKGACLVLNGDQIVGPNLVGDVLSAHRTTDAVATLGLLGRAEIGEYGGVLLADDRVTEIVESPQDDRNYRLNAGVYAFEPRIFDALESTVPQFGEHPLTAAFQQLVEADESVRGVVSEGAWIDVSYPWDLLSASNHLLKVASRTEGDAQTVDPSAMVHETAVIYPPAIVTEDCEIGAGAVVGPMASLRQNVTVGSNAVVGHSIIDMDSRIGPNATVIDCVAGQGVHIGAGTVIPGGPGDVRIGNRIHEGEQLSALFADRVYDEGGSAYVPGAVVGADTTVRSGATVSGVVQAETEVRS